MSVFHPYTGSSLTVIQPSLWKQSYELRDAETSLASLTFRKLIGYEAEATCDDGSWMIRQSGFWKSQLIVTERESGDQRIAFPIGLLTHSFSFEVPNRKHEKLTLRRDFFGTEFSLSGSMNRPLLHLRSRLLQFSPATLSIGDRGAEYAELPVLVFLVWYFSIVVRRTRYHAH